MKLGRFLSVTQVQEIVQEFVNTYDWGPVIAAALATHNADPAAHPALAVTDLLFITLEDEPQTIGTNNPTPISFDTEYYDLENFWVIGSPANIVIPADKTGLYLIQAFVGFQNAAAGEQSCYFSGPDEQVWDVRPIATASGGHVSISGVAYIYEATTLKLMVKQTSGNDLDVGYAQVRIARLRAI